MALSATRRRLCPSVALSEEVQKLIRVAEECLERAIEQCCAGQHLGILAGPCRSHAEAHGYSIVRDYVGHGIGRRMHEDPQIPNYGKPGTGREDQNGYVFAIEPMINIGTHRTKSLGRWLDGRHA